MTASIVYDKSTLFEGFTVSYKISEDLCKTILVAETVKKLDNVLESLNLPKLRSILKNLSLVIEKSIEDLNDGDVLFISCIQ